MKISNLWKRGGIPVDRYPIDTVIDPNVADRLDEVTERLETVVAELTERLNKFHLHDDENRGPTRAPVKKTTTKAPAKKAAAKKAPAVKKAPTRKKAAGG